MQKIQSVALIGMGALGILYGHTMARKMKEGAVTFLVEAQAALSRRSPDL